MELLERTGEIAKLDAILTDASAGRGSIVFVGGEAGIGKTRLITDWTASILDRAQVAWGACDDLITPIALGPFHDIVRDLGLAADALYNADHRAAAYAALLDALASGPNPTVTVIEDAHWADAASLDLIAYLGRRIRRVSALIVVTFRSDEVAPSHPMRSVMGDLPPDGVERLQLVPLSRQAVARLADSPAQAAEVYTVTGGNPFLVTEFLAAPTADVPTTVADSVLARVARLSDAARRLAEMVAIVPGRCERRLLGSGDPVIDARIEECQRQGLLEAGSDAIWFRHELLRRAVEDALEPSDARRLHGALLALLAEAGVDPARLVHHAERAGDVDALMRFAPAAARSARSAAAHREAYSHYERLWHHLDRFDEGERVVLLTEYTAECYFVDDQNRAIRAAELALALYRRLGDRRGEGAMLRWISRVHWWSGKREESLSTGAEAISVLESIPPSAELAMAYSNLAQLHMLAHEADPAIGWASRAIDTARLVGDRSAEAHALNNLGSCLIRIGDDAGWRLLGESLELSLAYDLDEHAARAYSNLGYTLIDVRDYPAARELLERGIVYTSAREIHGDLYYLVAERARLHFETGGWAEAEKDARWVMTRPHAPGITTLPALTTLARLQVRRGAAEAGDLLEDAWAQAVATGELQRMGPVAIGRAEHAWLREDLTGVAEAISPVLQAAVAAPQPWVTDEIVFWHWRADSPQDVPDVAAAPYAEHIAGEWRGAARRWSEIGCPYEEAWALADGDVDAQLAALAIFDRLGAQPAASLIRRRLRDRGVAAVPRGPRPSTRGHPIGLTPRQHEVLELVAAGHTNADIADRLFLSPKTVEHHVSAVLLRLGVATRTEAAERAHALGILTAPK